MERICLGCNCVIKADDRSLTLSWWEMTSDGEGGTRPTPVVAFVHASCIRVGNPQEMDFREKLNDQDQRFLRAIKVGFE